MKDLSWVLEDMDEDDLLDIEDELNKKEKEMTKKDFKVIVEILADGRIRERLDELEHQDVYEMIIEEFVTGLSEAYDNFDEDKFTSEL
tara:strand:+ start:50 stop:313 length:264 start_codon:yes stop_codon:yes gene_type:complete